MQENIFAQQFMMRLQNKVPDDVLPTILKELEIYMSKFDIQPKKLEIIPYDNIPIEYKTYMVVKKMEGLSDSSLKLYRIYLEDMLLSIRKALKDITASDIRLYLYQVQKQRGISNRTLDSRRLCINGFFKWLANEQYIPHNPMATVMPIKWEITPREPFTDIEIETLRKGCKNLRDKAMIEVFYSSGCRCGELNQLKKSDIDMENREIELFGKGSKHRTSLISARAVVALKDYWKSRKDNAEYAFVSLRRYQGRYTKLKNGGIEKAMHNIGYRVEMSDVYPHKLRHTFTTDFVNRGNSIVDAQKLLGHVKTETTLGYLERNVTQIKSNYRNCII